MFRRERKLQSHAWLPGEEGGRRKKTRRNWKNSQFSARNQHCTWKWSSSAMDTVRSQLHNCSCQRCELTFHPPFSVTRSWETSSVWSNSGSRGSGKFSHWVFLRHFCIFNRNDKVLNLVKQCCEPDNPLQSTACLKPQGSHTVKNN